MADSGRALGSDSAAALRRAPHSTSSVIDRTGTQSQWGPTSTVGAVPGETSDHRSDDSSPSTLSSSAAVAEWIAAVAHELRTVQTSIGGFAELMAGGELDAVENQEVASLISDQASEMTALIDDLMTVALAKVRRLPVHAAPTPGTTIAEELENVSRAFRGAPISLHVDAPTHDVVVDLPRLKQIVRGLLTNALKYGGSRIEIRFRSHGDRATVSVIDDGRGVPEHDRERIFRPHERAHSGTGLGLGLSIARQLVLAMGGRLYYADAQPGAAFVMELGLPARASREGRDVPPAAVRALHRQLIGLDREGALQTLNGLSMGYRLPAIADSAIAPVMTRLGDAWARGEVTVAQEHHASAVISEWLAAVAPRFEARRDTTVVCACVPGNDHEMGLALVATVLMEAGFPVTYLGRGLPVADIMSAVEQVDATVVLTSVAMGSQHAGLADLAAACAQRGVAIMFGGRGADGPIQGLPATYLGNQVSGLPAKLARLVRLPMPA